MQVPALQMLVFSQFNSTVEENMRKENSWPFVSAKPHEYLHLLVVSFFNSATFLCLVISIDVLNMKIRDDCS